jgi:hypothetical protein
MIAAAHLRACRSATDVLRTLGYDAMALAVDAAEWRRAGIDIPWGDAPLMLAARSDAADVYATDAMPESDLAKRFLRSLRAYNAVAKPVLVCSSMRQLVIYDLSAAGDIRRLTADLDEPSPHALDRLNLLVRTNGEDVARLFDRALDRDLLTRQFFERFRASVQEVAAVLRQECRNERPDAIASQALLILSRILFLYFIQQKGWLNGERRFLLDRLQSALDDGREFFATVLEPLFFDCLNTPVRQRDGAARALGHVPYLNGGLFDPSPFERRHADFRLPNELMQRIIERTFERFAFTADESDSSGVHVDPEMLGKVFESLMAGDERAVSGSFYTPRAIVDVLTSTAIREWASQWDRADAHDLLQRLQRVTILDPACGSGAFLLSSLRALETTMTELASIAGTASPTRQMIIERSLFGVDLKSEAVRLCELRLWLAIVAKAAMDIDAVPPLPNLDRNILQGNSLLSPTDFLGNARGDVYRDWLYAIRAHSDLVNRYRSAPQHERPALARLLRASDCRLATQLLTKATDCDERELRELSLPQKDLFGQTREGNIARCRELQQRIRDNRRAIERLEQGEVDFFSFDVHFAHVMATGGFDIVAGNPPWVRNSRIDPRAKRMFADRFKLFRARGGAPFHQPDLSVAFFERALALAGPHGVVSLLLPAKVLNASYAAPLRRAAELESVVAIHDWSDSARKYFDADTFPLGLTISKRRPRGPVEVVAGDDAFTVAQDSLTTRGSEWALLPPDVQRVIARLHRDHPVLCDTLGHTPVMGVKTGDNVSFFVDVKQVRGDVAETDEGINIPLRYLCRCVRGRDLRDGQVTGASWMLWPPPEGWLRIPRWLERFAESRGVDPDALRLAYVRPEHLGIKVAWKDVARGVNAAVLRRDMHGVALIPNQTLYVLAARTIGDANALAAVMSSTIFNALAVSIAERAKDHHYRYFGRTIARVPLPTSWRTASDARTLYAVTPSEEACLSAYLQRRMGPACDDD